MSGHLHGPSPDTLSTSDRPLSDPTAATARPARRRLGRWALTWTPPLLGAALVAVAFRSWTWPADAIWPNGTELWWVQAMAQAHMQGGPLGATDHLGWPLGFTPWSHPQLGLLFAVVTWLAGLLGIGTAQAVLVALCVAAALNGLATTYFLRSVVGRDLPWGVALISLAATFTPFLVHKQEHWNVAAFFVVPLALGFANRPLHRGRRWAARVCALAVAGFVSPAWWVIVMLLVTAIAAVVGIIGGRRTASRQVLPAVIGLSLASLGQLLLAHLNQDPVALATRGPWDSNLYGGFLTDILLGSPWANTLMGTSTYVELLAGASPGTPHRVGLVLAVAAAFCVFMVVAVFPGRQVDSVDPTFLLRMLTTICTLLYLTGGLGNLQAALAVLAGGQSPARVWVRMIIALGILGSAWLLVVVRPFLARLGSRAAPILVAFLVLAGVAIWFDGQPEPGESRPVAARDLPEAQAVQFLEATRQGCPVAQLPQDDFPMPRWIAPGNDAAWKDLYYSGFVPYLMAPNARWSYTSWYPGAVNGLQDVPVLLDDLALERLEERGFCAVLFDGYLSEVAAEAGLLIEGRDRAVSRPADHQDKRYSVYLLDPATDAPVDLGPDVEEGPLPGSAYVSGGSPEWSDADPHAFYWITDEVSEVRRIQQGTVELTIVPPPCADRAEVEVRTPDGATEVISAGPSGTTWSATASSIPALTLTALSPACTLPGSPDARSFYYGVQGLRLR